MKTYSIHKDNTSKETIKKIQTVLSELNITTQEDYVITRKDSKCDVTSVCISVKDSQVRANGKGMNKLNSFASGYSEFMERLQTGFLIDYGGKYFSLAPDEVLKNIKSFEDSLIYQEIKNDKILQNLIKIYRMLHFKKPKKIIYLPYISVKTGNTEYIPAQELVFLQASNGLAAGNTIKEALVQGLSEICERYVVNHLLEVWSPLPTISPSFYEDFDAIINTIKYIEQFGYKITVRDASVDKELPVVAVTFEDKNCNIEIAFGSHPSFPVAIERCLTEFLQGFKIEELEARNKKAELWQTRINHNQTSLKTTRIYLRKNSNQYKKLSAPDNKVNLSIYIENNNISNDEMYKILKSRILKQFNDIYIRDYSFCGFPTVSIYIPGMSLMKIGMDKKSLKMLKPLLEFERSIEKDKLDKITLKKIFRICEHYSDNHNDRFIIKTVSNIPLEVIALLCSIILKNKKNIKIYLNKILKLSNKYQDNNSYRYPFEFFKLLNQYYDCKSDEKFIETYGNKQYIYIKKFIDGLSENRLKQMLIQNKYKTKYSDNIKSIEKTLTEIYRKNMPQQENLRKLI